MKKSFSCSHPFFGQKTVVWNLAVLGFSAAGPWAGISAKAEPSVIQPGIRSWVAAAKTGRADIWFIGDSIAGSFDAGFNTAAAKYVGLAGTGLANDGSGGNVGTGTNTNYTYTVSPPYPLNSDGWDVSPTAVRPDRQSYVRSFGEPITAGASPAQFYSYFLSPGTHLDPQAAYDWNIYTASPDGGGSMQARRFMINNGNESAMQVTAPIVTQTPASGLQRSVFHFNTTTGYDGLISDTQLINTTDTSVLYSRMLKPGTPTGATVTTWSYGGHNAHDMYTDKYAAGPSSQAGRGQFLTAMTDGGSGKLMVTLEEGTNDASPTLANTPSLLNGILPGNSPAAFADNMTALIDGIKSDWISTGKPAGDLSFLVLGMYDYGHQSPDSVATHLAFSDQMRTLAQSRGDVSFIDLHDIAPTWDQANALGYMVDDVHPTVLGATVYSDALFQQLTSPIPEPSCLTLTLIVPLLLARRRWK